MPTNLQGTSGMPCTRLFRILLATFAAAVALSGIGTQHLRAEGDRAPIASAPSAEKATGDLISYKNLFDILKDGGVMMAPLFACSFIMLVFVFERAISLRRGRVIPRPFVKRFLHQVREGKIDRDQALELCQESGSPIADVFAAAVKKWGRPSVEMEQTIIDAGDRVSNGLRRYVRLFN